MRTIAVYYNDIRAGELVEHSTTDYVFRYDDAYYANPSLSSISVTLPKTQQEWHSRVIFPFFSNLLPEGENRAAICGLKKIDKNDLFSLLMAMRILRIFRLCALMAIVVWLRRMIF